MFNRLWTQFITITKTDNTHKSMAQTVNLMTQTANVMAQTTKPMDPNGQPNDQPGDPNGQYKRLNGQPQFLLCFALSSYGSMPVYNYNHVETYAICPG